MSYNVLKVLERAVEHIKETPGLENSTAHKGIDGARIIEVDKVYNKDDTQVLIVAVIEK